MNRFALGVTSTLLAFASCAVTPSQLASAPRSEPVMLAADTGGSGKPSRKEMVRRILPHNVRLALTVEGKVKRTGSGVVVGRERSASGPVGYVLTNAHVVEPTGLKSPTLLVLVDDRARSTEYPAEVVATGAVPDMDLALVRVPGLDQPPAELAPDEELEPGEDVVVAASPFGRTLSLSGGMVSQVEWDKDTQMPSVLKTDAAIGYGASGGGVFSLQTGRLLAIVEGYRTAKVGFAVAEQSFSFDVPMPGETFAAPTAKVRRFLASKGFGRLFEAGAARPASETARR